MISIFGRRNSANVQKVLWYCGERNLPFELTEVGGPFGQTREPWYVRLNPNSLVPVIVDGPLVLWESNAIVRYLDTAYGDERTPDWPSRRALADQWMDWASSVIMERANMPAVFVGLVRTPPEKRDQPAIERGTAALARAWAILDAHLERHSYVAGDTFSIGDIPVGIFAYRWYSLPLERPETPYLRRWIDRIAQRPAFQTHVAGPLS